MQKSPADKGQEKFSLYSLLQVEQKATFQQIKKQYRKLVIKYHPDKNRQDPSSRQKFQKLKQGYDILMNPEKRKIYDQTGYIENYDQKAFQSAYQYFRSLYKKVTQEDIAKFQQRYRKSVEEQEDLINYYQSNKGDMTQLLQSIPLSRQQDIERFLQFYQSKFEDGTLKRNKKYTQTKQSIDLLPNQEDQWQGQQKKNKQSMNELILAIRNKNSGKSFIEGLQQKYGLGKKKKVEKVQKKEVKKKKRL